MIWNRLGLHSSEIMDVIEDRKVCSLIASSCPSNPYGEQAMKKEKKDRDNERA